MQEAPYIATEQLWLPYINIGRYLNAGVNHRKYTCMASLYKYMVTLKYRNLNSEA